MRCLVLSILDEGAQYIGQPFDTDNVCINFFQNSKEAKKWIYEVMAESLEDRDDCQTNEELEAFDKTHPPLNTVEITEEGTVSYGSWEYTIRMIPQTIEKI